MYSINAKYAQMDITQIMKHVLNILKREKKGISKDVPHIIVKTNVFNASKDIT